MRRAEFQLLAASPPQCYAKGLEMQASFSRLAHSNSPKYLHIASLIFAALLAALLALLCLISPAHGQGQIKLPLIISAIAEQSAQQPLDVPDDLVTPAQVGKLLLPLVSAGNMDLATVVFPVGYSLESSISALGGRLTIQIPQQAVSMNNCTLTVVSPIPPGSLVRSVHLCPVRL